jgi:hypothetical protein
VTLEKKDLFDWLRRPDYFDFLWIDLNPNTTEIIEQVYEATKIFIKSGSVVAFIGGGAGYDALMARRGNKLLSRANAPVTTLSSIPPGISKLGYVE